jgi:hypothetical protein
VCSEDVEGLLEVDARLEAVGDQIAAASDYLVQLNERVGPDRLRADYQSWNRAQRRLEELQRQQQEERNAGGLKYPILLSVGYRPGSLRDLPPGELERRLGTWTDDILKNIEETRSNIAHRTLKLWDLRDVPQLTWQQLGLPADGPLGQVIERHAEKERSAKAALDVALSALGMVAGVVAGIATAGGAFLVAGFAIGTSVGVGLRQLGHDVARYQAESAASQVSVDPALAKMSTNEPELLPIVFDIVGIGMDIAGAVAIARQVAAARRGLVAAGRMEEFAARVRQLIRDDAVANRVIARAAQDATVMRRVEAAADAVRRAARSMANLDMARILLEVRSQHNVFAEWAAKLLREERVCVLSEAAIRQKFTNETGLAYALDLLDRTSPAVGDGIYDKTLSTLFVFDKDPEHMALALVHDSVHFLQDSNQRPLLEFLAEYQAHWAERDYLLSIRENGGTLPPTLQGLLTWEPDELARFVSRTYQAAHPQIAERYAIPATFEHGVEAADLAKMVCKALTGTP